MIHSPKQRILISSSVCKTIKESADFAQELEIGLEISRVPLYKNKNLTVEETISHIKEQLQEFDGRITMHAMFSDVNVAGGDCILREYSQQRCYQSFEIAKGIGADTLLFHSGNKGTKHIGSQLQFKERYIEFWKVFIKRFEDTGIQAVVENVFEETPQYCIELMNGIGSEKYKLALDTGHANLYAPKTDVLDWIREYGKNLYHMHLHNNYQTNDDHSNFENGTLDFKKILTEIKNLEITPSFVFEMFKKEDIITSYKMFKEIMN